MLDKVRIATPDHTFSLEVLELRRSKSEVDEMVQGSVDERTLFQGALFEVERDEEGTVFGRSDEADFERDLERRRRITNGGFDLGDLLVEIPQKLLGSNVSGHSKLCEFGRNRVFLSE